MVDIAYVATLDPPATLEALKQTPGLEQMMVIQRGSRLSVQPVRPEEWEIVLNMGKSCPSPIAMTHCRQLGGTASCRRGYESWAEGTQGTAFLEWPARLPGHHH